MRAVVFQIGFVEVDEAAVERVEKALADGVCVACLVKPPLPGHRGCCGGCYSATRRAILAGLTTDEQRVAAGKLLPEAKRGRKASNAVTVDVA